MPTLRDLAYAEQGTVRHIPIVAMTCAAMNSDRSAAAFAVGNSTAIARSRKKGNPPSCCSLVTGCERWHGCAAPVNV